MLLAIGENVQGIDISIRYVYKVLYVPELFDIESKQRIVTKEEMENFESVLSDHHRAITADGSTLVQRAVIEHNILSVSVLYRTVTFTNLGKILGVSPSKGLGSYGITEIHFILAEKVASKMIEEERMKGEIDQVDEIVRFDQFTDEELWNQQIKSTCNQEYFSYFRIEVYSSIFFTVYNSEQ